MKNLLRITCAAGTLLAASSALSQSGEFPRLAGLFGPADPCQTSCQTQAKACREQCAHPQEPEQCIVDCTRSECNSSCDAFEKACGRHCQSSK
jgi:hypothetical protein